MSHTTAEKRDQFLGCQELSERAGWDVALCLVAPRLTPAPGGTLSPSRVCSSRPCPENVALRPLSELVTGSRRGWAVSAGGTPAEPGRRRFHLPVLCPPPEKTSFSFVSKGLVAWFESGPGKPAVGAPFKPRASAGASAWRRGLTSGQSQLLNVLEFHLWVGFFFSLPLK